MWNRIQFQEKMNAEKINFRYWGKYGKLAVAELEEQLHFKFDPETRSFIEEIGNLELDGYSIVIAGSEDGKYNCITEMKQTGLIKENTSVEGILIECSDLYHILYADGTIKAYEFWYIEPDGVIRSYDSLTDLVNWIIEI